MPAFGVGVVEIAQHTTPEGAMQAERAHWHHWVASAQCSRRRAGQVAVWTMAFDALSLAALEGFGHLVKRAGGIVLNT